MGRRDRVVSGLLLAAIAGLGVVGAARLEVDTDITRFLPEGDDPAVAEIAREVARSELNRTMSLTIEADNADEAADAARRVGEHLAEHPEVAWVRFGPSEALQTAFYEIYFPHRFGFAASSVEQADELVAHPEERAAALTAALASPTSPLLGRIAPEDPWLLFPAHLERLRSQFGQSLRTHRGALVADDRYGVVLLASRRSPFDVDASVALLEGIDEAFEAARAESDSPLTLERAGIHRFVIASASATKSDIVRVSTAGSLFVLLLLFAIFRSPRLLFLGHLPIVLGLAGAVATSSFVLGRVHGLTLAFGATLIGVAIDYISHYLNHQVLAPGATPRATMRRIVVGLALGAATTVAGLLGLGWTGHGAIQEMALFTSSGVAVAFATSAWLLPPWMPEAPKPTRLHLRVAAATDGAFDWLAARPWVHWLLLGTAAAIIVGGALRAELVDDMASLSNLDPALVAEEEAVRARVAGVDQGRFVVSRGATMEEALAVNDEVFLALEPFVESDALRSVRSAHPLLRSAALQREVHGILAEAKGPALDALEEAGVRREALGAFEEALAHPPEPLTLDSVRGTPTGELLRPFFIDTTSGVAALTFLGGGMDSVALIAELETIEGATLFDQRSYTAAGYRRFRTRTTELLLLGLLFVAALVLFRYRDLRRATAALAPAVLSGAVALGVVALAGMPLTFIHIVTVLVVLSMGVDYGIFLVESSDGGKAERTPTLVGLLIAATSTTLSFGALALSTQPAIRAMGTVTAAGVLASLILAPTAWLLLARRRP